VSFFEFLEDDADEAGVGFGPTAAALEGPAVDDVAVQDEFFAADVAQKMIHFRGFALGGAEVDIGEDDGADSEFVHAVSAWDGPW